VGADIRTLPVGLKLVLIAIALRSFGWGVVDPYFAIFIEQFSANYSGVGLFMMFMNILALIATFPLLRVADKVKDSTIMRDGEVMYFFMVVFFVLAGLTMNILFLFAALIFYGLASPVFFIGSEAYIRKYGSGIGASKSFAMYTAIDYLGWILGMLVTAFIFPYIGLTWMFVFIAPGVILGFYVLRFVYEGGLRNLIYGIRKYFHRREDFTGIVRDIRSLNPKTFFFLILAFFDGILIMFSYIFIPLFAIHLNLPLSSVALLMALMYLPFCVVFFLSDTLERMSQMRIIALGLLITAVSFALLSVAGSEFWLMLLILIKSFAQALMRPAYNGIITHLTPRKMLGEISGVQNLFIRMGYIVSPLFSGVIADLFGIRTAFLAIALMAVVLVFFTILFKGFETAT
jgi:MFS family permease